MPTVTVFSLLKKRRKLRENRVIENFFRNKTILITGGSMGIGRGLALRLAEYKTKLILCARGLDMLKKTALECKKAGADDVCIVQCDVTSADQCKNVVQEGLSRFGCIDVLILNAGISGSISFEDNRDLSIYKKMMEVNFMGYVNMVHHALPHLTKAKDARIGVISSISGKVGVPFRSAYCASKFAVNGFFSVLRNELYEKYPNLKISVICPGWVNTDIRKRHIVEKHVDTILNNQSTTQQALSTIPTSISQNHSIGSPKTDHVHPNINTTTNTDANTITHTTTTTTKSMNNNTTPLNRDNTITAATTTTTTTTSAVAIGAVESGKSSKKADYDTKKMLPVEKMVHGTLYTIARGERDVTFGYKLIPLMNAIYPEFVDYLARKSTKEIVVEKTSNNNLSSSSPSSPSIESLSSTPLSSSSISQSYGIPSFSESTPSSVPASKL